MIDTRSALQVRKDELAAERQLRLDLRMLRLAWVTAEASKDPRTRVGAVLADGDAVVATGYNGLPRGVADTPERLNDREAKLRLVVHAEMNAILNAARLGIRTAGTTLYVVAGDACAGGAIWGGAPCLRCAVEVIQAGIKEVVSFPFKSDEASGWRASVAEARAILAEAGVLYREVDPVHIGLVRRGHEEHSDE